jgi:hypothetical protein
MSYKRLIIRQININLLALKKITDYNYWLNHLFYVNHKLDYFITEESQRDNKFEFNSKINNRKVI